LTHQTSQKERLGSNMSHYATSTDG